MTAFVDPLATLKVALAADDTSCTGAEATRGTWVGHSLWREVHKSRGAHASGERLETHCARPFRGQSGRRKVTARVSTAKQADWAHTGEEVQGRRRVSNDARRIEHREESLREESPHISMSSAKVRSQPDPTT